MFHEYGTEKELQAINNGFIKLLDVAESSETLSTRNDLFIITRFGHGHVIYTSKKFLSGPFLIDLDLERNFEILPLVHISSENPESSLSNILLSVYTQILRQSVFGNCDKGNPHRPVKYPIIPAFPPICL
ncbi:hypothetical protein DINM_002391 [Dirofilaria immitis]|nr:hypothetical protein [Dirofilaria immitis]